MKILYNINTGYIYAVVENTVDVSRRYKNYPAEIMDNLMELPCPFESVPRSNVIKYKVVKGEVVDRPKHEIQELKRYGRLLSEEERLNILLQPTGEEVNKAELTLEILSTLQEVGLI